MLPKEDCATFEIQARLRNVYGDADIDVSNVRIKLYLNIYGLCSLAVQAFFLTPHFFHDVNYSGADSGLFEIRMFLK